MTAAAAVLVVLSLAFAWSMGAHYTGAVMGMPYASHSIKMWPALASLALMTLIGATFGSEGVQRTVGLRVVDAGAVTAKMLVVVIFGAFALTTIYTYYKVPTSTIQILIFCLVGAAVSAHVAVHWQTIVRLAVVWVLAPPIAAILGFVFTRLLDLALSEARRSAPPASLVVLPRLLVLVGLLASLVLGANDVSNAVGVWSAIDLANLRLAGFLGGLAMAIGALTWGRRILNRVAFDIVKTDLAMASAAQFVQAFVVLLAVFQGLFTSMNQALVGAMYGTGLARGRETVNRATLLGIVRGWAISPVTGFTACFLLYKALPAVTR